MDLGALYSDSYSTVDMLECSRLYGTCSNHEAAQPREVDDDVSELNLVS